MSAFGVEFSADGCGGGSDLEDPEHVQGEDEHEDEQDDDNPWILKLVAPVLRLAARSQCRRPYPEKDATEDAERCKDTNREADSMHRDGAAVITRLLDKSHDLQADHGKHAGHEVEQQAADKHPAEDLEEAAEWNGFSGERSGGLLRLIVTDGGFGNCNVRIGDKYPGN